MSSFKIRFRPEIEGLRAIAVIVVILYHAQISISGYQFLKGGFIGVDIFFVISGYLITSIILKELTIKKNNSFKFINFYKRRIIRILPALLLVMFISLPFAWFYLTPSHLLDFSKSIFHSLGFSSNFYFWGTGQKYNAASEILRPFLHTWSLSVEVQYYILFPTIFFIIFKYFRRYLIYILTLGFIVSLSLADWGSRNYQHLTFYVLPTRVWELLAGSIFMSHNYSKILKELFLVFFSFEGLNWLFDRLVFLIFFLISVFVALRSAPPVKIAFVFSLIASLSWLIVAKPHSDAHYDVNYIVWYLSYIPFSVLMISQFLVKKFQKSLLSLNSI